MFDRLKRKSKTFDAMLRIYCQAQHQGGRKLCPACSELKEYAAYRLSKCPFQAAKPACAKCRVHCYKPEMRERVRAVMRFSGPKLLYRRPMLALLHLLARRRKNSQPRRGER